MPLSSGTLMDAKHYTQSQNCSIYFRGGGQILSGRKSVASRTICALCPTTYKNHSI